MNVYDVEVKTKTENRETLDRFSVTGETPDEALLSAFAEPKPNIVGTCEFIFDDKPNGFHFALEYYGERFYATVKGAPCWTAIVGTGS